MKKTYIRRTALALGLAALASTAMADGAWRNVNSLYLQDPAYLPGWNGAIAAVGDGVGEVWNGAFDIYQVILDAPAGEYTLTANAFYRFAGNDRSKEEMKDGANHNAYLYLGNAKTVVEGLFDKEAESYPNGMGEANAAFEAGRYVNTVKYNHAGGDLVLGLANTGGVNDEWCCFDNFKLVGPNGEIAIVNGDFSEGIDAKRAWDCDNVSGSSKTPDVNRHGGVYRKSNASPYNIGQRIALPAGKYRFSVQSFLRHGNGNEAGKFVGLKGEWAVTEGESAFDLHNNGGEVEANNAYIYVTSGWDTDENGNKVKPVSADFALDAEYGNPNGFYKETAIKCIFDEKLDVYPDNEPYNSAEGDPANGLDGWEDSGCERQSAACFVKNPDLYRNYVEFELTEPTEVYVGLKKDVNAPTHYWNPWRDIKLEMLAENGGTQTPDVPVVTEGDWQNVNGLYLQDPAYLPGWNGAIAAVGDGVGEVWNGAFDIYQVILDAPAGEYTLTANAFYRFAGNDRSKEEMKDGANHNAYLYLGTAKTPVEGLFDKEAESYPNGMGEANTAFEAGRYLNTVKYNHAGGDLVLGLANTGGVNDEWCCFDNFKIVGPNGEVAIVNGDFSEGIDAKRAWDCANISGSEKTPDANRHGGVYRKSNASPYNIGQRVALPAGKYRFSVQSFLRHGNGNEAGKFVGLKGEWAVTEGESAFDLHNNGGELEANNAYIYVTSGWDTDENGNKVKPVSSEFALDAEYGNPNGFYKETAIKCIFDEKLDVYPDNEPYNSAEGDPANGLDGWEDSGCERQSAACFVNNPDLYRNYVEFELTEPTEVYVGLKKDVNAPTNYWNPWRDIKLEVLKGSTGVETVEVEDVNAPVEYYNLQGVRVANPSNGIFIVKKGNKTTKQIFK